MLLVKWEGISSLQKFGITSLFPHRSVGPNPPPPLPFRRGGPFGAVLLNARPVMRGERNFKLAGGSRSSCSISIDERSFGLYSVYVYERFTPPVI